jgi:2-(1,2-epoxy-1,2-dihydrophenyl)acetyl-CoA isomerase
MLDGGDSTVSVSVDAGVVTITLNRAERHNSLVPQLLCELRDAFRSCDETTPGPVVLRASGPSFSTGGDLGGFLDHAGDIRTYSDRLVGLLNEAVVSIFDCPLPVIVAVDGQVTGGSLGLVLAADIVLVTERASFRPYYVDVGFSPDGGWAVLLPEIIGRTRALAIQLLNQRVSADQALEWGLATAYADSSDLEDALADLCARLRSKQAQSIRQTRRLLRPRDLESRLEMEKRCFIAQISAPEALDGIRRFLDGDGDDD